MNELKEQIILFWKSLKPAFRLAILAILLFMGGYFLLMPTLQEDKKSKSPADFVNMQLKTKGFELFDDNIWMKGEKELEILNLRALKGQLERDLLSFESIERATVTLDLSSENIEISDPPKASIILKLLPERSLSYMEIQSVLYYLTGAVKNLKPQRIAIADSSGRLYTEISEDSSNDTIGNLKLFEKREEQKNSLNLLLLKVLNSESFVCRWSENENLKFCVNIVIDEKIGLKYQTSLLALLETIYKDELEISLHPFNFKKDSSFYENFLKKPMIVTALSIIFLLIFIFLLKLFLKRKVAVDDSQEPVFEIRQKMPSLEKERPKILLETFSSLNQEQGEAFIENLSFEDRSELLIYLSKDGDDESL